VFPDRFQRGTDGERLDPDLFIGAVAVHLAMTALGLAFFGAEGMRASPLIDASLT
jgi:hypothetical protein